jgi:flagellar biosynthesis anti-sigma factor FlgM
MKISGTTSKSTSGLDRSAAVGPAGVAPGSKQSVGQTTASDQAQLSSLSRYLVSALSGSPEHVAKVNELGTAVSSGRYQVDAHAVSGSIIQYSIEFGGASYLSVNG